MREWGCYSPHSNLFCSKDELLRNASVVAQQCPISLTRAYSSLSAHIEHTYQEFLHSERHTYIFGSRNFCSIKESMSSPHPEISNPSSTIRPLIAYAATSVSEDVFRHASVSSTYPFQSLRRSVRRSVGHYF